MYRKLYSKITSSTMILCMIVTLFIPSCNVKAADIAMEYTSYEVLQWILMELGISASVAPEKQQTIVLPDGQEITKPNLGAELIREVNDSIELWWNANQMDDVVDGYDGGFEQFKSDFADMLEWGKDGVIDIASDAWSILQDWGESLCNYLADYEGGKSPIYSVSGGQFVFTWVESGRSCPVSVKITECSDVVYAIHVIEKNGYNGALYLYSLGSFKCDSYWAMKKEADCYLFNVTGYRHDGYFIDVPITYIDYDVFETELLAEMFSRILHGNFSDFAKDVIWQDTDLKTDVCGIPWELPDSIPYPHSGDATITIPQDLPIDDAITGVGTGELTWEDVIGKSFPIPIDKPIDKPAEGDTETDTEKDTEEETESEKEIEWDDTIFAPDGAIGGKLSELSKKFPFCIPFDVFALFKGFGKDVVETAPRWEVSIDMPFIYYKWIVVIDMKDYEKYVKIFRDGFYLLFLVGLFFTTRKLISWQID